MLDSLLQNSKEQCTLVEQTCSLAGANEPAIVALLHDIHDVSLVQLNLVLVLRLVVVEGTEPAAWSQLENGDGEPSSSSSSSSLSSSSAAASAS